MTEADYLPAPPELTADQAQLLADQEIDEEHPGTILKDFQTLLDFVGQTGSQLPASTNCFPWNRWAN